MQSLSRFSIFVGSLITVGWVMSCNYISSSAFSENKDDTTKVNEIMASQVIQEPVYLMDKLDSLNKNLMYFPAVDSINKIDPRVAKKNLKDSIFRELRKKPKHVYLTFDDGPLIGSAAIDSIATAKNIKITAFLVGRHAKMSKRLERDFARYMNNPLVQTANHSYTHANHRYQTFYSNPAMAVADFERCQQELGLKDKIVRLPGRNMWMFANVKRMDVASGRSTVDSLFKLGYQIYGWDVEWKMNGVTGVPVQTVDQTYRSIKSFMSNNLALYPNNVVLLMHDDMFQNKKGQQLLSNLIDSLQKHDDYRFEFISNYPVKY